MLLLSVKIRMRRLRWIGHVLRRDGSNITRTSLTWAPESKGRPGRHERPEGGVQREKEGQRVEGNGMAVMREGGGGGAKGSAGDRDGRRAVLNGLRGPAGHEKGMR